MTEEWRCFRSDPRVFMEFIGNLVRDGQVITPWSIEVQDVFCLDASFLDDKVQALIFLYELNDNTSKRKLSIIDRETARRDYGVVHLKQTIQNACGPIAASHVLANLPDTKLELSDEQPIEELIRKAVDKVSEQFKHELGETTTHFVALLPKSGRLWELDGRLPGPIDCGEIKGEEDTWKTMAMKHFEQLVAADPTNYKFGILAVSCTI